MVSSEAAIGSEGGGSLFCSHLVRKALMTPRRFGIELSLSSFASYFSNRWLMSALILSWFIKQVQLAGLKPILEQLTHFTNQLEHIQTRGAQHVIAGTLRFEHFNKG